jgi:hypothetical protein
MSRTSISVYAWVTGRRTSIRRRSYLLAPPRRVRHRLLRHLLRPPRLRPHLSLHPSPLLSLHLSRRPPRHPLHRRLRRRPPRPLPRRLRRRRPRRRWPSPRRRQPLSTRPRWLSRHRSRRSLLLAPSRLRRLEGPPPGRGRRVNARVSGRPRGRPISWLVRAVSPGSGLPSCARKHRSTESVRPSLDGSRADSRLLALPAGHGARSRRYPSPGPTGAGPLLLIRTIASRAHASGAGPDLDPGTSASPPGVRSGGSLPPRLR